MENKDNINGPNIRKSMENLQKERNNVEVCLYKIMEMRKSLEMKIISDDNTLSAFTTRTEDLEALNKINDFKIKKSEKDVAELEEKMSTLKETTKNLCSKIDSNKKKRVSELEQFQTEALNLCQLFGSSIFTYNESSIEGETLNIHKAMTEKQREYEEIKSQLIATKNELDDIVLYQIPLNKKEIEIPIGQRKMVLNIFEDAHVKAKNISDHLKNLKALKLEESNSF